MPLIIFDPRADNKTRSTTVEQMVLNVDIAPTILELAGIKLPKIIQGQSLVPLLRGRKPKWRTDFFYEHLRNRAGIPKSEAVRTERWKYIRYFEQRPIYEELYDLENDKLETHNLINDPKFSKELNRLRRRCDELLMKVKGVDYDR